MSFTIFTKTIVQNHKQQEIAVVQKEMETRYTNLLSADNATFLEALANSEVGTMQTDGFGATLTIGRASIRFAASEQCSPVAHQIALALLATPAELADYFGKAEPQPDLRLLHKYGRITEMVHTVMQENLPKAGKGAMVKTLTSQKFWLTSVDRFKREANNDDSLKARSEALAFETQVNSLLTDEPAWNMFQTWLKCLIEEEAASPDERWLTKLKRMCQERPSLLTLVKHLQDAPEAFEVKVEERTVETGSDDYPTYQHYYKIWVGSLFVDLDSGTEDDCKRYTKMAAMLIYLALTLEGELSC